MDAFVLSSSLSLNAFCVSRLLDDTEEGGHLVPAHQGLLSVLQGTNTNALSPASHTVEQPGSRGWVWPVRGQGAQRYLTAYDS